MRQRSGNEGGDGNKRKGKRKRRTWKRENIAAEETIQPKNPRNGTNKKKLVKEIQREKK
jgi:hypothetical protein